MLAYVVKKITIESLGFFIIALKGAFIKISDFILSFYNKKVTHLLNLKGYIKYLMLNI